MITIKKFIDDIKNVFVKISIQWFLFFVLSISMLAVTLVLGFNLFHIYTIDIKESETSKLRIIARDWYKFTNAQVEQLNRILKREEVLVEKRMKDILLLIKASIRQNGLEGSSYKNFYDHIDNKNIDLMIVKSDGKISYAKEDELVGENLKNLVTSDGVMNFFNKWDSFMKLNSNNVYTLYVEWPFNIETTRKSIMVFTFSPKNNELLVLRLFYEDFKSFELKRIVKNEIRDMIAQEKIGPRGYIWVFDSKGGYVVSKDRVRDRENIYDEKDQNNNYPVREIILKALELKGSETDVHYYYWKNIGELSKRKIAAFSYMPEWDWIIGASSYEEDFLSELKVYKERMIIIGSVAVLISLIIAFFISILFSKPIKKLEYFARMISEGQLDFDLAQEESFFSKEIYGLFNSFKSMAGSIKFQIETIQNSKAHFEELNDELMSSKDVLEENNLYLMSEIEQRLSTEYRLIEQKELVNTVVNNISQFVYWKDVNRNYLGSNKKYSKLLNVDNPQDLVDKNDDELQDEELHFVLFPEIEQEVLEYGVAFYQQEKMIIINKQSFKMICDVLPIKNSEEKVVGIIAIMTKVF